MIICHKVEHEDYNELIFEYKEKGENMTVYHVETKEAYDELMIELEEKGRKWLGGVKPTQLDEFKNYDKDTYIYDESGVLSFSDGYYFKAFCSNETLIEYKVKGENMKLYHTETQVDYDALMIELEEKGYKWLSGDKPTSEDYWIGDKEDTCIAISGKEMTFGSIEWHKKECPGIPIIKYKAKGEKMAQEVESDLQEAKLSAKKLIEKIGEFLETLKPEFKVGDYATVDVNGRKIIAKIDELTEKKKMAHGLWYDESKNIVKQDFWFLSKGNIFDHSTPEEIAKYEVALTFHKHGRKPFEVKEGDLIEYPNGHNIMIYYPEIFSKVDFLNDGFKLVKTAEEVNEWLENK